MEWVEVHPKCYTTKCLVLPIDVCNSQLYLVKSDINAKPVICTYVGWKPSPALAFDDYYFRNLYGTYFASQNISHYATFNVEDINYGGRVDVIDDYVKTRLTEIADGKWNIGHNQIIQILCKEVLKLRKK